MRPWLSASALLTRRLSSSQTPTPCKILSQGCNLRSGQLPWGRDQVRVCLRTQTGRLRRRTEPRQGQSRRVSLQGASDSASGTKPGLEASHRPWEDSANKTLVNGHTRLWEALVLWAGCPDRSWVSNPLPTWAGMGPGGPRGCHPPAMTEPVLALPIRGSWVVLRNPLLCHFVPSYLTCAASARGSNHPRL